MPNPKKIAPRMPEKATLNLDKWRPCSMCMTNQPNAKIPKNRKIAENRNKLLSKLCSISFASLFYGEFFCFEIKAIGRLVNNEGILINIINTIYSDLTDEFTFLPCQSSLLIE